MNAKQKPPVHAGFRQNGDAIREIRTREGWTVDELANEITKRGKRQGVIISGPHLRNIENGWRNASVQHLALISEILGCTIRSIRADFEAAS